MFSHIEVDKTRVFWGQYCYLSVGMYCGGRIIGPARTGVTYHFLLVLFFWYQDILLKSFLEYHSVN